MLLGKRLPAQVSSVIIRAKTAKSQTNDYRSNPNSPEGTDHGGLREDRHAE
jgi:hypothetical protein